MEYLGAWGTLIYEKNLKSKISCQTPFKAMAPAENYTVYNTPSPLHATPFPLFIISVIHF